MRLKVRHQTAYRYEGAVAYAVQALRLTPRPYEGLAVHHWKVQGETRRELPAITDGYGNLVHVHTVAHPHSSAAVFVEGEVETTNTWGVVRGAPEPLPPLFFLRSTRLTECDPGLTALAGEAQRANTPLKRLHALLMLVRQRLEYRPGVTDAATPAAEALAAGAGVCQDHAHVFIAVARRMGIPARYVGGYLWTGEDGHEYQASHAWAEAYIPDLGWVGFDPSNGVCPTEAYIRASTGLDYWSAAPVRGIRQGFAAETLSVKVRVSLAQEQQQQ